MTIIRVASTFLRTLLQVIIILNYSNCLSHYTFIRGYLFQIIFQIYQSSSDLFVGALYTQKSLNSINTASLLQAAQFNFESIDLLMPLLER